MNKSFNAVLEDIRSTLSDPDDDKKPVDEEAKLGTGKRFNALVAKLSKRKDVKDPAALAAWIGRKKYGKERMSKMAHESKDTEERFVFDSVEDVLAFVEGLEELLTNEE